MENIGAVAARPSSKTNLGVHAKASTKFNPQTPNPRSDRSGRSSLYIILSVYLSFCLSYEEQPGLYCMPDNPTSDTQI